MHLVKAKASVEMKPDNTMNGCHIMCVEMSDCKRSQKGDRRNGWVVGQGRKEGGIPLPAAVSSGHHRFFPLECLSYTIALALPNRVLGSRLCAFNTPLKGQVSTTYTCRSLYMYFAQSDWVSFECLHTPPYDRVTSGCNYALRKVH